MNDENIPLGKIVKIYANTKNIMFCIINKIDFYRVYANEILFFEYRDKKFIFYHKIINNPYYVINTPSIIKIEEPSTAEIKLFNMARKHNINQKQLNNVYAKYYLK